MKTNWKVGAVADRLRQIGAEPTELPAGEDFPLTCRLHVLTVLLCSGLAAGKPTAAAEPPQHRNIVFILADEIHDSSRAKKCHEARKAILGPACATPERSLGRLLPSPGP